MKKFRFKKIIIVIILLFIIPVWSFFIEPEIIIAKHYKVNNEKLAGIRVVFVSDLHLKKSQEHRLKRVVKKINKQNPDVVLLGGDFVNGHTEDNTLGFEKIAGQLSNIDSQYGVYSILGNHDWWFDGEKVKEQLAQNNIKVLLNSNISVNIHGKKVCIAGTEDLMTRDVDLKKTLQGAASPVILLTHSPDIFPVVPDFVDLTLSGHTHGGQIVLPFIGPPVVPSDYGSRYASGFIIEDSKKMIVTKGLGTSIIPARFNCLPEIVIIDFE